MKKIICYFVFLATLSLCLASTIGYAQLEIGPDSTAVVRYTSQGLRDPFQSPFDKGAPTSLIQEPQVAGDLNHLQVQGMVWGSQMPQAIINNVIVNVGDIIGDAKIIDVRREGVYVLYQGQEYILKPATIE